MTEKEVLYLTYRIWLRVSRLGVTKQTAVTNLHSKGVIADELLRPLWDSFYCPCCVYVEEQVFNIQEDGVCHKYCPMFSVWGGDSIEAVPCENGTNPLYYCYTQGSSAAADKIYKEAYELYRRM